MATTSIPEEPAPSQEIHETGFSHHQGLPGAGAETSHPFAETLRGSLGWLLSRAAQGYMCALEQALERHDLTLRDFVVLQVLRASDAPQQQTVARAAAIDKTTLVATLDHLERRQFVLRRPDVRDRRVRILELTDAGRATAEAIAATSAEVDAGFLDGLDDPDRESLFIALRHLVDHTAEACADSGSCI